MLRLPLVRDWPASRWPTWFTSGQSVCSGWGSEFISCARVSLLMKVTWAPRGTVNACGHTALFTMRIAVAFGSVEQGSDGDGEVPLELPPPHAAASTDTARHAAMLGARVLLMIPVCTSRGNTTAPAG